MLGIDLLSGLKSNNNNKNYDDDNAVPYPGFSVVKGVVVKDADSQASVTPQMIAAVGTFRVRLWNPDRYGRGATNRVYVDVYAQWEKDNTPLPVFHWISFSALSQALRTMVTDQFLMLRHRPCTVSAYHSASAYWRDNEQRSAEDAVVWRNARLSNTGLMNAVRLKAPLKPTEVSEVGVVTCNVVRKFGQVHLLVYARLSNGEPPRWVYFDDLDKAIQAIVRAVFGGMMQTMADSAAVWAANAQVYQRRLRYAENAATFYRTCFQEPENLLPRMMNADHGDSRECSNSGVAKKITAITVAAALSADAGPCVTTAQVCSVQSLIMAYLDDGEMAGPSSLLPVQCSCSMAKHKSQHTKLNLRLHVLDEETDRIRLGELVRMPCGAYCVVHDGDKLVSTITTKQLVCDPRLYAWMLVVVLYELAACRMIAYTYGLSPHYTNIIVSLIQQTQQRMYNSISPLVAQQLENCTTTATRGSVSVLSKEPKLVLPTESLFRRSITEKDVIARYYVPTDEGNGVTTHCVLIDGFDTVVCPELAGSWEPNRGILFKTILWEEMITLGMDIIKAASRYTPETRYECVVRMDKAVEAMKDFERRARIVEHVTDAAETYYVQQYSTTCTTTRVVYSSIAFTTWQFMPQPPFVAVMQMLVDRQSNTAHFVRAPDSEWVPSITARDLDTDLVHEMKLLSHHASRIFSAYRVMSIQRFDEDVDRLQTRQWSWRCRFMYYKSGLPQPDPRPPKPTSVGTTTTTTTTTTTLLCSDATTTTTAAAATEAVAATPTVSDSALAAAAAAVAAVCVETTPSVYYYDRSSAGGLSLVQYAWATKTWVALLDKAGISEYHPSFSDYEEHKSRFETLKTEALAVVCVTDNVCRYAVAQQYSAHLADFMASLAKAASASVLRRFDVGPCSEPDGSDEAQDDVVMQPWLFYFRVQKECSRVTMACFGVLCQSQKLGWTNSRQYRTPNMRHMAQRVLEKALGRAIVQCPTLHAFGQASNRYAQLRDMARRMARELVEAEKVIGPVCSTRFQTLLSIVKEEFERSMTSVIGRPVELPANVLQEIAPIPPSTTGVDDDDEEDDVVVLGSHRTEPVSAPKEQEPVIDDAEKTDSDEEEEEEEEGEEEDEEEEDDEEAAQAAAAAVAAQPVSERTMRSKKSKGRKTTTRTVRRFDQDAVEDAILCCYVRSGTGSNGLVLDVFGPGKQSGTMRWCRSTVYPSSSRTRMRKKVMEFYGEHILTKPVLTSYIRASAQYALIVSTAQALANRIREGMITTEDAMQRMRIVANRVFMQLELGMLHPIDEGSWIQSVNVTGIQSALLMYYVHDPLLCKRIFRRYFGLSLATGQFVWISSYDGRAQNSMLQQLKNDFQRSLGLYLPATPSMEHYLAHKNDFLNLRAVAETVARGLIRFQNKPSRLEAAAREAQNKLKPLFVHLSCLQHTSDALAEEAAEARMSEYEQAIQADFDQARQKQNNNNNTVDESQEARASHEEEDPIQEEDDNQEEKEKKKIVFVVAAKPACNKSKKRPPPPYPDVVVDDAAAASVASPGDLDNIEPSLQRLREAETRIQALRKKFEDLQQAKRQLNKELENVSQLFRDC